MSTGSVAVTERRGQRALSFLIVSSSFILLIGSSGTPVPLFAVYQAEYGVRDSDLATAFAAYVTAVAVALLLFGRLSDVWGRRGVGVMALVVGAAACVVMSGVEGAGELYVGRALQGLAIGTGSSALGTWAYELR
ncbi:MFS transporter, partial [Pseudactinotalea sp.]|uniref:MFS transporter n=1 Tax=Pseudactinotalea sp. TaxID=1926260 RepID=UPI003B3B7C17